MIICSICKRRCKYKEIKYNFIKKRTNNEPFIVIMKIYKMQYCAFIIYQKIFLHILWNKIFSTSVCINICEKTAREVTEVAAYILPNPKLIDCKYKSLILLHFLFTVVYYTSYILIIKVEWRKVGW